jgi:hypothetical protein
MEKVRARISEMPNRCKLVVESSRRARYNNVEEEIEYFGVSLKYTPVPSILTPTGARFTDPRKMLYIYINPFIVLYQSKTM